MNYCSNFMSPTCWSILFNWNKRILLFVIYYWKLIFHIKSNKASLSFINVVIIVKYSSKIVEHLIYEIFYIFLLLEYFKPFSSKKMKKWIYFIKFISNKIVYSFVKLLAFLFHHIIIILDNIVLLLKENIILNLYFLIS